MPPPESIQIPRRGHRFSHVGALALADSVRHPGAGLFGSPGQSSMLSDATLYHPSLTLDLSYHAESALAKRLQSEAPPPTPLEPVEVDYHLPSNFDPQTEIGRIIPGSAKAAAEAASIAAGNSSPRPWNAANDELRLVKTLGLGSFAAVYLGESVRTGELFAIKALFKFGLTEAHVEAHRVEIESLCRVAGHPYITNLFRVVDEEDITWLIMEYCPMDLYETIADSEEDGDGLGDEETKRLFGQIVEAVSYAQLRGVWHRDLKPENILVGRDGNVRLADFGLSHLSRTMGSMDIARADIETTLNIGSLRYEAPELLNYRTEAYRPSRADMWSLGIILLNCLRGKSPWQEANSNDPVFRRFQRGEVGVIKNAFKLSEEGWYVVSRMLQIDPEERATVEEVLSIIDHHAIASWLKEEDHSSHPYFHGGNSQENIVDRFSINTPKVARNRWDKDDESGLGPRNLSDWASDTGDVNFASMPLFHFSDEEGDDPGSPLRRRGAKFLDDDDDDDLPEPGSQGGSQGSYQRGADSEQTAVDHLSLENLSLEDHERAMFNRVEIASLK